MENSNAIKWKYDLKSDERRKGKVWKKERENCKKETYKKNYLEGAKDEKNK